MPAAGSLCLRWLFVIFGSFYSEYSLSYFYCYDNISTLIEELLNFFIHDNRNCISSTAFRTLSFLSSSFHPIERTRFVRYRFNCKLVRFIFIFRLMCFLLLILFIPFVSHGTTQALYFLNLFSNCVFHIYCCNYTWIFVVICFVFRVSTCSLGIYCCLLSLSATITLASAFV